MSRPLGLLLIFAAIVAIDVLVGVAVFAALAAWGWR